MGLMGGVLVNQAVPLGRVYSFPTNIVIPQPKVWFGTIEFEETWTGVSYQITPSMYKFYNAAGEVVGSMSTEYAK
jgi:hypothetical protein